MSASDLEEASVRSALAGFLGDIDQVPTAVSAIKVDGVRAYAKVRAGEDVALAARPVTVHRLDVLARRDVVVDGVPCVDLDVVVECSSGTYVRALARDLGTALGTAIARIGCGTLRRCSRWWTTSWSSVTGSSRCSANSATTRTRLGRTSC